MRIRVAVLAFVSMLSLNATLAVGAPTIKMCRCRCGIDLNVPCGPQDCDNVCGYNNQQPPAPFSPFLPQFIDAQTSVEDSLGKYSQLTGKIIGTITEALLKSLPRAQPKTLDELDEAAENLAQFFEGYRQAYVIAARDVVNAERELRQNRSRITTLVNVTADYRRRKKEWERAGALKWWKGSEFSTN